VIRAAVSYVTGADALRIAGPANASVTVLAGGKLRTFAWIPDELS
jgi:hypothetical protein